MNKSILFEGSYLVGLIRRGTVQGNIYNLNYCKYHIKQPKPGP